MNKTKRFFTLILAIIPILFLSLLFSGTETKAAGGSAVSVSYRTHVQTYGWQDWKVNGATAGTSGKAKRLEAIQIRLTGEMANRYDVYYRVHAETYGWLAWVKNGEVTWSSSNPQPVSAAATSTAITMITTWAFSGEIPRTKTCSGIRPAPLTVL